MLRRCAAGLSNSKPSPRRVQEGQLSVRRFEGAREGYGALKRDAKSLGGRWGANKNEGVMSGATAV